MIPSRRLSVFPGAWLSADGDFAALGVEVVYFPYSFGVSSTILRERLSGELPAA
jgi:hypothetical protein